MPSNYEDERSPWQAFTVENGPETGNRATKGRLFGSVVQGGTAWYSYSGRRSSIGGLLDIVSTYSQIWSCITTNGRATSTSFYTQVLPAYTDHARSYGFPVRCVRE
ncbi:MAG: hypothetical protein K2K83_03295 [Rikenella sp.]|nr:hypothetical protein [Rikenella sp.]